MLRLVFIVAITSYSSQIALAQTTADSAGDKQSAEQSKQTPKLLKKYYRHEAEKYKFTLDEAGKQKLTLQPTVMTWTGDDYKNAIGTVAPNSGEVYIWTYEGRAVVVGGIGSFPFRTNRDVFHEFHVLTEWKPLPTRIHNSNRVLMWKPLGEPPRPIEGAPDPVAGDTPAARNRRLFQMRKLAGEFQGSTVSPEEKGGVVKLRLLPAPLYRLDPKTLKSGGHGVVDGALFVFVGQVGTDAEMLLNIECRKTDHGLEFSYVPAAWTYLEMWMEHNRKEVWRTTRYTNDGGEHNYFTGIAERISADEDLRARLDEN